MSRATSHRLLQRLQRDRELQRLLEAIKGSRRLRRRDAGQLNLRLQSHFGLYQELHARRDDLDEGTWRGAARVLAWLVLNPGVSTWWSQNASHFDADFAATVDSILAPQA